MHPFAALMPRDAQVFSSSTAIMGSSNDKFDALVPCITNGEGVVIDAPEVRPALQVRHAGKHRGHR